MSFQLLQALPPISDPQWTNQLHKLLKVTNSTIYSFIVDRKVFLRKVSDLEEIADNHAETYDNSEINSQSKDDTHVPIEYTRTLSKAYRFFKDGHVQDIRYHPMPQHQNYIGVRSNVLPSMRKDRVYNTAIILCETTARVANAHCTCIVWLLQPCNSNFVLLRRVYSCRSI